MGPPEGKHGEEMHEVRDQIKNVFAEVYRQQAEGPMPPLSDDLVLLRSGLDSLAFGILVARLEEELGYDPFSASDEPYYPRTFGEFVAFYERHAR